VGIKILIRGQTEEVDAQDFRLNVRAGLGFLRGAVSLPGGFFWHSVYSKFPVPVLEIVICWTLIHPCLAMSAVDLTLDSMVSFSCILSFVDDEHSSESWINVEQNVRISATQSKCLPSPL